MIEFDDKSRFVFMSDVHRSNGSTADNFIPNQNIAVAALRHYYTEKFTYVELGDGDELWMNKNMKDIKYAHRPVFELLEKFKQENKLHVIFGNHDMKKRKNHDVTEGIVLRHKNAGQDILLIHGHQPDFLNYDLWRLAKFLVRYVWQPLSLIGIKDPTSAVDSGKKKERISDVFTKWADDNNCIVVAGHTHHSLFPDPEESKFFNDGCCVYPRYITAIELAGDELTLVKWCIKSRSDDVLYVAREIIKGPAPIHWYWQEQQQYSELALS